MADKEYIDREAAKKAIFDYICGHAMSKFPSKELFIASKRGAEGAFNEIDYVPAADVVEVVRCKECKHGHWNQETCHGKPIYYCDRTDLQVSKYDFCSYGVRKELMEKVHTQMLTIEVMAIRPVGENASSEYLNDILASGLGKKAFKYAKISDEPEEFDSFPCRRAYLRVVPYEKNEVEILKHEK